MSRKITGVWLVLTSDGKRKLNPRTTPRRIAAVRLANLKKLFPMVRGEMNSSPRSMPTPSCENIKKKVDEITLNNSPGASAKVSAAHYADFNPRNPRNLWLDPKLRSTSAYVRLRRSLNLFITIPNAPVDQHK